MSQKSSTFIQQTRERDAWLAGIQEREGAGPGEAEQLVATAALTRGAIEAIRIPEEAEDASRATAIAYMDELRVERLRPTECHAPWYLRIGHFMRFVFTLGRRK